MIAGDGSCGDAEHCNAELNRREISRVSVKQRSVLSALLGLCAPLCGERWVPTQPACLVIRTRCDCSLQVLETLLRGRRPPPRGPIGSSCGVRHEEFAGLKASVCGHVVLQREPSGGWQTRCPEGLPAFSVHAQVLKAHSTRTLRTECSRLMRSARELCTVRWPSSAHDSPASAGGAASP